MNGIKGQTNQTAEEKWLCLRRKRPTRRQKYTLNEKSLTLVILLYSISNKNPAVDLKNNQNITDIHLTLSQLYQNRLMTKIISHSFTLSQRIQLTRTEMSVEECRSMKWGKYISVIFPSVIRKTGLNRTISHQSRAKLDTHWVIFKFPSILYSLFCWDTFSLHVQKRHLKSVLCVNIPIGPQH